MVSDSEGPSSDIEVLIPDYEKYVDPCSEFKWLKVIDGETIYQRTEYKFRHNMEEPEHEMAELAFELFDQFGCFQSQSKKHPVKRGSGVWSDGPNNKNTVLIEELTISPTHQQQGIGPRLPCAVQELASEKSGNFVGISWPGVS
ncbi:conserved hypothetical protein [Coccidioides posadasii str. Silveira]|uniref:Uncharacterized protein n=2 Tax=Coccidioides posadasii TaxID=199306 RepID=E9D2F9_COCPS|nr:conserved hypothetical protein [Coccidioides posadasii str. Silveira]KMM71833.1 hypothetical protein CPAG_08134 [Coccidioides posadasii RMSCC 3488]